MTQIYSARNSGFVALDPAAGYVYVTNPEDNSVTVLREKQAVGTYSEADRLPYSDKKRMLVWIPR